MHRMKRKMLEGIHRQDIFFKITRGRITGRARDREKRWASKPLYTGTGEYPQKGTPNERHACGHYGIKALRKHTHARALIAWIMRFEPVNCASERSSERVSLFLSSRSTRTRSIIRQKRPAFFTPRYIVLKCRVGICI